MFVIKDKNKVKEKDLYNPVISWLESFIRIRNPKSKCVVFDSSSVSLVKLIELNKLDRNLPGDWRSWDIQIDIAGFIIKKNSTDLAFVECKTSPITLAHLSQLIGYCRVVKPEYSFILSPKGISDSLASLLQIHNRLDVLSYNIEEGYLSDSIVVAKWDSDKNSIAIDSIITGDRNKLGILG